VPNSERGTAFAVIFMLCAIQAIVKAAATALLAVTNSTWLWVYIAVDHGLHFAYRMIRRYFIFYIAIPTTASYVYAPLQRVMLKVIVDFTGTLAFRLPLISGGSYWLFSLVMSHASVFVSIYIYNKYAEVPEGVAKMDGGTLWAGAGWLSAAWCLIFCYFAFRIAVPKYRFTLWSRASGRRVVQDYFLKGEDDEDKFGIFRCNLLLWESAIGEEVKAWTMENWARWKEEKPAWFTPGTIASCPDRFIPQEFLPGLGGQMRERRGSAMGSVRESFRMSAREEVGGE
jgi:hypothetical protein